MSRIGKNPVELPAGVEVTVVGDCVTVKGTKGSLTQKLVPEIGIDFQDAPKAVIVTRKADTNRHKAMHGLYRSLVKNMVVGVTSGYEKRLFVQGTGYRAEIKGNGLSLQVGFANTIVVDCPNGIEFETPKSSVRDAIEVVVRGIDKQLVGETAARIRAVRPCDPYKAKGIRYSDEVVRRLEGKSMGA